MTFTAQNRAVFVDRDGVINENIDLLHRRKDIIILPRVNEALKRLKAKGFLLIGVTNQPSVARGLVTEKEVDHLNELINSKSGNYIDKFYFCPHHPNANLEAYRKVCVCRKPAPGMLLKVSKNHHVDLKNSWLIGDMRSDIAAGKSAGCQTIMIKSPNNEKIIESGVDFDAHAEPDLYAEDLFEASQLIVRRL
jgi:D-glycero-D-manno-heptose 1,7-bisphosphate phosphatase